MDTPSQPCSLCELHAQWVQARLASHPLTRHLAVSAHGEAGAVVLEGHVSAPPERRAGRRVARVSAPQSPVENRIVVWHGASAALSLPPHASAKACA